MGASTVDVARLTDNSPLHAGGVWAVGIGNALEFYDFITFSFFAIQIGHAFFPESRTSHGLLYSLGTFGVGFLTRPLGGIVIGRYGDRAGRKQAMMLSFGLMGFGIVGLALTPSYAQIGIAAPLLLVAFRLLQGFALGGEVGPSTAFLMEVAPAARRGLYISLQNATQGVATLASGLVGVAISGSLSPAALDAWGWRAAFLIGAMVVPLGLYIRRSLPETLRSTAYSAAAPRQRRVPVRLLVLGLMMLQAATIATYVRGYMTTYAQDNLRLGATTAFGATVINGLCVLIACPLAGLLADRIGRRPVMLGAICLLIGSTVPCFIAMNRFPSVGVVYAATGAMSALGAATSVPMFAALTESLPMAVRSSALSILYAVAIAVFGGSTQFVIKWLIDATGSVLAPAFYLTGALIIGCAAMIAMPETAPAKTSWSPEPEAGN